MTNPIQLIQALFTKPAPQAYNWATTMRVAYAKGLTVAQINAGVDLIANMPGAALRILPTGFKVRARSAAGAGMTSLLIRTKDGTPVNIASVAVANLGQDTVIDEAHTSEPAGAGFLTVGNAGKGVQVIANGTATGSAIFDIILEFELR